MPCGRPERAGPPVGGNDEWHRLPSRCHEKFSVWPSWSAARSPDGDGKADIAVGAGPGGGPHVVLFDGETFAQLSSTYAFDQVLGGGVYVG